MSERHLSQNTVTGTAWSSDRQSGRSLLSPVKVIKHSIPHTYFLGYYISFAMMYSSE